MGLVARSGRRNPDDGTVLSDNGDYISGIDQPPIHIRIQSSTNGDNTEAASEGDDLRANPLHNDIPFKSAPKAYAWANRNVPGRRVRFEYFADIYDPTLGSDQRNWGINTVESTGKRLIRLTDIYTLPYGEACRVRATHHGPRKMTTITQQLTSISGSGGDLIDTGLNATGFESDTRSWIRSWVSSSDKREVFFKIPIGTFNGGVTQAKIDSQLTSADINERLRDTNAVLYQVQPSVLINPPDGVKSCVHIHGDRTRLGGDREFSGDIDNPADVFLDFENLHIVRMVLNCPARFAECMLDDKPTVEWMGAAHFYNCIVVQLLEYRGQAMPLINSWQKQPQDEPCGRPLVFHNTPNPSVDDPVIPRNGTNLVVQGSLLIGGESLGQPAGSMVFTKGLSFRSTNISVTADSHLIGNARARMYMHDTAVLYGEAATGIDAIWFKDGAEARINSSTFGVDGNSRFKLVQAQNRHLRVGIEAAVACGTGSGQFLESAGINGNLISAFDRSRIWDRARELADAAYNEYP
jgi:hypothetical protein